MLESPKEKLLSCLVYKKQRRAMLFSGIMSVTELDFVIMGMKSLMSEEDIKACEVELEQYESRQPCGKMHGDLPCELFFGHPGRHIAIKIERWETQV